VASTNDIIFLESMANFLANTVDICFGSMSAKSTAPAACIVIEGNAVTTNQQIETDLSSETHPPTPNDLIVGIDRVEGMLSDTIKICECVKRPRMTSSTSSMPLGLSNAAHMVSRYMKHKIQIEFGPKTQDRGSPRATSMNPALSTRTPNTQHVSAVSSRSSVDLLLWPTAAS
jgi:hypothetical protein